MGSERPLRWWTGPLERCGIWQGSCNCSPETKKSQHHQNEHFWEGFTRELGAHERREREAGENIYSFCVNNIYICEKIDLVVVRMSFIALLLNCHILPRSNLCPLKLFSFVYWKTWKSKAQAVHPPGPVLRLSFGMKFKGCSFSAQLKAECAGWFIVMVSLDPLCSAGSVDWLRLGGGGVLAVLFEENASAIGI